MNKKLIYVFAVLVAGLFVVSACSSLIQQEEVGARIRRAETGGIDNSAKIFASMSCSDNGGNGYDPGGGSHYAYKCSLTCEDGAQVTYYTNENEETSMGYGRTLCDNSTRL